MGKKIGEDFFRDAVDRGRRELGGLFYHDSNIAQPMYPLRGNYEAKQIEAPEMNERPTYEELHPVGPSRDDQDRDDRDRDIDRE